MAIIRGKRDANFTIMRNEGLQDARLSFKARGLMAYMLSLPDDWKFYVKELVNHSNRDGRDAVLSGLKELEKIGYLQRTTHRKKGKFDSVDYLLVDIPVSTPETENPDTAKPDTDNPAPGKPDTANPQLQSTNGTKDLSLPSTDGTKDDEDNIPTIDPIRKSWTNLWTDEPNPVVSAKLWEWSQTLSPELVCFAIQVAGEHSVKQSGALKYLTAVINGWLKRNINSLDQAKKAAAEHDKRSQHRKQSSSKGRKNREVKPKWLKDQEAGRKPESGNQLTEQQQKELADRVKNLDSKEAV